VFAILEHDWHWWLAACLAVLFDWVLWWKQTHGQLDWQRVAYIELRDGEIALVPSRVMRQMGYMSARASFPDGSCVECCIETGDRYFTGDHGQCLQRSLWIVSPNRTKQKLAILTGDVSTKRLLANLPPSGVPFRAIKVYDGQEGEHTETDVTARYVLTSSSPWKKISVVLIGTSSLWLGCIAGTLIHSAPSAIALGIVGYLLVAGLTVYSKTSKRSVLIQAGSLIPTYAGGYALAVIAVWYVFKR